MPRRKVGEDQAVRLQAAARLAATCQLKSKPVKKKGSRVPTARTKCDAKYLKGLVDLVQTMIETGDWKDEKPAYLVALFCWFHEQIYGVSAISEVKQYYLTSVAGLKRLQEEEFDGSFEKTRDYIRWIWGREADREEWRKANRRSGGRLTWRKVFVDRDGVTDWRLENLRKSGIK